MLGRLVDRRGQPLVLLAGALVCALALLAFAALPHGASLASILPCAVVAGAALPPLGACLRTLWPALLGSAERVHAAFALESAVLEMTYIAGPVLIAGAIGAWSLAASAVDVRGAAGRGDARLRAHAGVAGVAAAAARRGGARGRAAGAGRADARPWSSC